MKELNRNKQVAETDKQYKKRITDFYKSERATLKDHRDIRLRTQGRDLPKDLAEIIWRLNMQKEATYFVDNSGTHCETQRSRTENDLYLLVRYYIDRNVKFKFISELLFDMTTDEILYRSFCNTIHRHTYNPRNVAFREEKIRSYLEKKGLNLKVPQE